MFISKNRKNLTAIVATCVGAGLALSGCSEDSSNSEDADSMEEDSNVSREVPEGRPAESDFYQDLGNGYFVYGDGYDDTPDLRTLYVAHDDLNSQLELVEDGVLKTPLVLEGEGFADGVTDQLEDAIVLAHASDEVLAFSNFFWFVDERGNLISDSGDFSPIAKIQLKAGDDYIDPVAEPQVILDVVNSDYYFSTVPRDGKDEKTFEYDPDLPLGDHEPFTYDRSDVGHGNLADLDEYHLATSFLISQEQADVAAAKPLSFRLVMEDGTTVDVDLASILGDDTTYIEDFRYTGNDTFRVLDPGLTSWASNDEIFDDEFGTSQRYSDMQRELGRHQAIGEMMRLEIENQPEDY